MTNRRRSGVQAAPLNRRGLPANLQVVQRTVISAAGQSVSELRPNLLRYFDLHPALTVLTGVAIIALVCVIYLSQVTAVTNANYTLQALQSEHTNLLQEKEDLSLLIGRAQSLRTIETIARDKLKMVPIDDQYKFLPIADGSLTAMPPLPTPALPYEAEALPNSAP